MWLANGMVWMFVCVCNGLIGAIKKAESGSPADPGVPVRLMEGLRGETCRASVGPQLKITHLPFSQLLI